MEGAKGGKALAHSPMPMPMPVTFKVNETALADFLPSTSVPSTTDSIVDVPAATDSKATVTTTTTIDDNETAPTAALPFVSVASTDLILDDNSNSNNDDHANKDIDSELKALPTLDTLTIPNINETSASERELEIHAFYQALLQKKGDDHARELKLAVEQEQEKTALVEEELNAARTTIRTMTKLVVELGGAIEGGLVDGLDFEMVGDDDDEQLATDETESESDGGVFSVAADLDVIDGTVSNFLGDEMVAELDDAKLSSAADLDVIEAAVLISGDDMGVTAELQIGMGDLSSPSLAVESVGAMADAAQAGADALLLENGPAADVFGLDGGDLSVTPEPETVDLIGAVADAVQAGADALLLQDGQAGADALLEDEPVAASDFVESISGAAAGTGVDDDGVVSAGADALLLEDGPAAGFDVVESMSGAGAGTGVEDGLVGASDIVESVSGVVAETGADDASVTVENEPAAALVVDKSLVGSLDAAEAVGADDNVASVEAVENGSDTVESVSWAAAETRAGDAVDSEDASAAAFGIVEWVSGAAAETGADDAGADSLLEEGSVDGSDIVESVSGAAVGKTAGTGADDDARVTAGADALLLQDGPAAGSDTLEWVSGAASGTDADESALDSESMFVGGAVLEPVIVVDNGCVPTVAEDEDVPVAIESVRNGVSTDGVDGDFVPAGADAVDVDSVDMDAEIVEGDSENVCALLEALDVFAGEDFGSLVLDVTDGVGLDSPALSVEIVEGGEEPVVLDQADPEAAIADAGVGGDNEAVVAEFEVGGEGGREGVLDFRVIDDGALPSGLEHERELEQGQDVGELLVEGVAVDKEVIVALAGVVADSEAIPDNEDGAALRDESGSDEPATGTGSTDMAPEGVLGDSVETPAETAVGIETSFDVAAGAGENEASVVPLNVTVMDLGLTEAAPALEDVFEEVALPADTAVGVDSLGGRYDVSAGSATHDGALEPLDLTVVMPEETATALRGAIQDVDFFDDNGDNATLLEDGGNEAASNADVLDGGASRSDQALPEMVDKQPSNDYREAVTKHGPQQQQHNLGADDDDQRLATMTTVSETEAEAAVAPDAHDFLVAHSLENEHEQMINPVNDNDSALGSEIDVSSVLDENFSAGSSTDLNAVHQELTLDFSASMDLTASEPTTTMSTSPGDSSSGADDEFSQPFVTEPVPAELDMAFVSDSAPLAETASDSSAAAKDEMFQPIPTQTSPTDELDTVTVSVSEPVAETSSVTADAISSEANLANALKLDIKPMDAAPVYTAGTKPVISAAYTSDLSSFPTHISAFEASAQPELTTIKAESTTSTSITSSTDENNKGSKPTTTKKTEEKLPPPKLTHGRSAKHLNRRERRAEEKAHGKDAGKVEESKLLAPFNWVWHLLESWAKTTKSFFAALTVSGAVAGAASETAAPVRQPVFAFFETLPSVVSWFASTHLPAWSNTAWIEYGGSASLILMCVSGVIWLCFVVHAEGKATDIRLACQQRERKEREAARGGNGTVGAVGVNGVGGATGAGTMNNGNVVLAPPPTGLAPPPLGAPAAAAGGGLATPPTGLAPPPTAAAMGGLQRPPTGGPVGGGLAPPPTGLTPPPMGAPAAIGGGLAPPPTAAAMGGGSAPPPTGLAPPPMGAPAARGGGLAPPPTGAAAAVEGGLAPPPAAAALGGLASPPMGALAPAMGGGRGEGRVCSVMSVGGGVIGNAGVNGGGMNGGGFAGHAGMDMSNTMAGGYANNAGHGGVAGVVGGVGGVGGNGTTRGDGGVPGADEEQEWHRQQQHQEQERLEEEERQLQQQQQEQERLRRDEEHRRQQQQQWEEQEQERLAWEEQQRQQQEQERLQREEELRQQQEQERLQWEQQQEQHRQQQQQEQERLQREQAQQQQLEQERLQRWAKWDMEWVQWETDNPSLVDAENNETQKQAWLAELEDLFQERRAFWLQDFPRYVEELLPWIKQKGYEAYEAYKQEFLRDQEAMYQEHLQQQQQQEVQQQQQEVQQQQDGQDVQQDVQAQEGQGNPIESSEPARAVSPPWEETNPFTTPAAIAAFPSNAAAEV